MSMAGPSPSSQTTSPWNPSPRRTWQICQPTCSTFYCTSMAMITPSITTLVRRWPCPTHSLSSVHKAIEEAVWQCETCTQFQAQNAAAPLTPTPTPSCPWQICAMDIFTLKGTNYLICGHFYSKMTLIQCLPCGQSNAVKVVLLLKEMFSEHGIPEVLHSDNGLQYASAQFTEFCTSWAITHKTSSPHYLQSNGFAEAYVQSVKHALQCAKYSGTDPQLTLLAL